MIFSKQNKDRLKDQSGFCTGSWGAGDVEVGEKDTDKDSGAPNLRCWRTRLWSVYETG
jgi:hypothetical protein